MEQDWKNQTFKLRVNTAYFQIPLPLQRFRIRTIHKQQCRGGSDHLWIQQKPVEIRFFPKIAIKSQKNLPTKCGILFRTYLSHQNLKNGFYLTYFTSRKFGLKFFFKWFPRTTPDSSLQRLAVKNGGLRKKGAGSSKNLLSFLLKTHLLQTKSKKGGQNCSMICITTLSYSTDRPKKQLWYKKTLSFLVENQGADRLLGRKGRA